MQFTLALVALAAATVSAQGVTSVLSPTASAPAGCSTSYAGNFEITVVLPTVAKRDIVEKRSTTCASDGTLVASLTDSILTDALGRIGGIVSNGQFQFDGPPSQAGTIYNAGWSVCSNGSLALGGSSVFYQCLSGDFYNLYDYAAGASCEQVIIDIIPCTVAGSATATTSAAAVTQASDGQGQAASAVSQTSDGQPQAESATAVAQITDGQVQASSAVPVPVSQYTDGQIQVTAVPVTVAAVSTAVAQITDGQIQASSAVAAVSQISDGQIQATAAATATTAAASTLITLSPVSQISDGQVQATAASNATATTTSAAQFTGAASMMTVGSQLAAGAAALFAFAML